MKEETQAQQEEMTKEQEKELIIKNAFEFLKRQDLIIVNGVITFPFLKANSLKEYETHQLSYCKESLFCKNKAIKIKYKSNKFGLSIAYLSDDQNLIKLFDKIYNRLKAQQEQAKQPQDTTDYTIKYDQNKPKLSQFPREAMEAVAEVMEYGARKYGSGTWSRVEIQRYIDAGVRHLYAMQDIDENGKECINLSKLDEESGLEHLYHLACNVVYAVALYKRGKDETR